MAAEEHLIVFVKLPTAGHVKTRLAKTIGHDTAAALYRCFVCDTLAAVARSSHPATVFVHPPEACESPAGWLGPDIRLSPQKGNDLGERMCNAFREIVPGCSRVVLVGSDCPDLPTALPDEAFDALKTHDAVIGPAADGGYYLIGFSSTAFTDAPFKGIAWGGPDVFRATMAVLEATGKNVHILPLWNDVDEYDDLQALYDRHSTLPPGQLSTIDFIRDHLRWMT